MVVATKTFSNRVNFPSIFNDLRDDPFLIGFDHLFDRIVSSGAVSTQAASYPPYNIVKSGDNEYAIELAIAGFSEDEISVSVDDDTLTIESKKDHSAVGGGDRFLHQGIAERNFKRKWTLSPTVDVVEATLVDGLLQVVLVNKVPETPAPRVIELNRK